MRSKERVTERWGDTQSWNGNLRICVQGMGGGGDNHHTCLRRRKGPLL